MIDEASSDEARSDEELAELVQAGRVDLWPELAERILRMSRPIVYRKVAALDAEDVHQDCFIRAWKALPAYSQRKGTLRTYVAVLSHRQVVDYLRMKGKQVETEDVEVLYDVAVEAAVHPNPSGDLSSFVESIVGEEASKAVHLRVFEGYSYTEIGEAMRKSEAAAKQQVWNALRKLRECLETNDE